MTIQDGLNSRSEPRSDYSVLWFCVGLIGASSLIAIVLIPTQFGFPALPADYLHCQETRLLLDQHFKEHPVSARDRTPVLSFNVLREVLSRKRATVPLCFYEGQPRPDLESRMALLSDGKTFCLFHGRVPDSEFTSRGWFNDDPRARDEIPSARSQLVQLQLVDLDQKLFLATSAKAGSCQVTIGLFVTGAVAWGLGFGLIALGTFVLLALPAVIVVRSLWWARRGPRD